MKHNTILLMIFVPIILYQIYYTFRYWKEGMDIPQCEDPKGWHHGRSGGHRSTPKFFAANSQKIARAKRIYAGAGTCGSDRALTTQQMADKWCELKKEGKAISYKLPDGTPADPNAKQLPRGFGSKALCFLGDPNYGHNPTTYAGAKPLAWQSYGTGPSCKAVTDLKCSESEKKPALNMKDLCGEWDINYTNGFKTKYIITKDGKVKGTNPVLPNDGERTMRLRDNPHAKCPGTPCYYLTGVHSKGKYEYLTLKNGELHINHYNPNFCCTGIGKRIGECGGGWRKRLY